MAEQLVSKDQFLLGAEYQLRKSASQIVNDAARYQEVMHFLRELAHRHGFTFAESLSGRWLFKHTSGIDAGNRMEPEFNTFGEAVDFILSEIERRAKQAPTE